MEKQAVVRELEKLVSQDTGVDYDQISNWAYKVRLDSLRELDRETLDVLEDLGSMNMGPEFEWSKEDLQELILRWKR